MSSRAKSSFCLMRAETSGGVSGPSGFHRSTNTLLMHSSHAPVPVDACVVNVVHIIVEYGSSSRDVLMEDVDCQAVIVSLNKIAHRRHPSFPFFPLPRLRDALLPKA